MGVAPPGDHVRERRALVDAARFGAVRHVTSDFSFPGDDAFHANNIRVKADCEPLGCLGDLGWYNIRFSLWAHGWAAPATAQCTYHRAAEGNVPTECSAVLSWADGRSATFHCAFTQALTQTASVVGAKGRLSLNDFVVCKDARKVAFSVETDAGMRDSARECVAITTTTATENCCQEAAMFETFAGLALGGPGADGRASPDARTIFEEMDTNRSGKLNAGEFFDADWRPPAEPVRRIFQDRKYQGPAALRGRAVRWV